MKIVSWNCSYNGGLSKEKVDTIQEYRAGILVIQECTYFECIRLKSQFASVDWYGDGKDSILGIGVFSNNYQFNFLNEYAYGNAFRYVILYMVNEDKKTFNLLAV